MSFRSNFGFVFAAMAALMSASCDNTIEDRIARSPQTGQDRADSEWSGALSQGYFEIGQTGGASAGDPLQFGCQTRDYGDAAVLASVQTRLAGLQRQSLGHGREMCGFVYIGQGCQLNHTVTTLGTEHSCNPQIPNGSTVLASYHTHGISHGNNAGEIPSDTDFRTTIALQVDGYVATPAGRFWHIDTVTQTARLLCRSCMPVDPGSRNSRTIFDVGREYRYVDILAAMRANGLTSGSRN